MRAKIKVCQKFVIGLVLMQLCIGPAFAQNEKHEATTISLLSTRIEGQMLRFSIDSVIDNRPRRDDTLTVWDMPNGKKVSFLLNGQLDRRFKDFFAGAFGHTEGEQGYYISVNQLLVHPKNFRDGMTFVDISYYKNDSKNSEEPKLTEIFRIGTWEDRDGVPKSNRNGLMLASALRKSAFLFQLFLSSGGELLPQSSESPTDSTIVPKGFYFSLEDFQNRRPLFDADVEVHSLLKRGKNTNMYSIEATDSTLFQGSIGGLVWGYSDGKDMYFSTRNYQNTIAFSKVKFIGHDYFIFYHDKVPPEAGLVAGSIGVGILTGLLTGIAVVPYFENYKGLVMYEVDKNMVSPASYENLRVRAKRFPAFFNDLRSAGKKAVKGELLTWWQQLKDLEN